MRQKVFHCPSCGRRYHLDVERFADQQVVVICGNCEQPILPNQEAAQEVEASGYVPGRPSILIAHEAPSVCATVGRIVRGAGFAPRYVARGAQVLAAFDPAMIDRPLALVLDVGIPDPFAFDVISSLRASSSTAQLPIVLLASVYDPTRYKRKPTTLHGADGYLELHHVPDRLPGLLASLLEGHKEQFDLAPHTPEQRANAEAIRQGSLPHGAHPARVEARRVVSDMALYSEAEFARAAVHGLDVEGFAQLLEQGRQAYEQAIQGLPMPEKDLFLEAVEEILQSFRVRGA